MQTIENLDIVQFIENNPLNKLKSEYNSRIINKIKESFTNEEQRIFVTTFYTYLNYDEYNDFVIDFDLVWKWCGFSRKDHSKTLLLKCFEKDKDYVINLSPATAGAKKKGVVDIIEKKYHYRSLHLRSFV